MKKISSFLILCMLLTLIPSVVWSATSFPDMPSDHWAITYVNQLVSDGTVSGFEDGTFRPEGTVLREQFVKMIGKGPVKSEVSFHDVSPDHWAYDYIMYSGLDGDKTNQFHPSKPITRGDVAQLLWKRAGSKTGIFAPSIITRQHKNPDAAAWVYQYGIMTGNDGLNLRLDDTLTRAEAAALIVRGREQKDGSNQAVFLDTVNFDILDKVYQGAKLNADTKLDANRTFTNGEVARMALRLATERYNLTYKNMSHQVPFEHEYARDLSVMTNYLFDEGKLTLEFANSKATVQDALCMLTYGLFSKTHDGLAHQKKDDYYSDAAPSTTMENICLTFAKQNGIQLYPGNKLNASRAITGKEMAAIMLQLDGLAGFHSKITIGGSDVRAGVYSDHSMLKDASAYPANSDLFQAVLEGLPSEVYSTPYTTMYTSPKKMYDLTREHGDILLQILTQRKDRLQRDHGITVRFTYYPTLVCNNGSGYTMRVKCEIINAPSSRPFGEVFACLQASDASQTLYSGMELYMDVAAGAPLSITGANDEQFTVEKIIKIVR